MATKADVTDALKHLQKITNNYNLIVSNSGGHALYLKEPRASKSDGVIREHSIITLGSNSTAVHNKLLSLIEAHWILAECTK